MQDELQCSFRIHDVYVVCSGGYRMGNVLSDQLTIGRFDTDIDQVHLAAGFTGWEVALDLHQAIIRIEYV